MKKLILLAAIALLALPVYGQTNNGSNGATIPSKTGAVGGKDSNGKLRTLSTTTAGVLYVSSTTAPLQYTGTPSSYAILSADGTVFTLAAGEIGFIQNLSADAPLAVKYGASASTTSLNFILAAGTADSDGKGGAIRIDNWVGVVSVAKMTGTGKYLAWKQAP